MSKYTVTIKNLIDNGFDFELNDYPIFDNNYRDILNQKILYHYYENEIGLETPALFRFYLKQRMNEIMPKYNVLYVNQMKLIDNLTGNVNLTETFERESDAISNTSSQSDSNSNNKNLFQDTPQGNISNTAIDNQTWATNLTLNNGQIADRSSSSGDTNTTENYIKKIIGNNGNKYNIEVLNDLKNNFLNIDMLIIDELYDLFMQIF